MPRLKKIAPNGEKLYTAEEVVQLVLAASRLKQPPMEPEDLEKGEPDAS